MKAWVRAKTNRAGCTASFLLFNLAPPLSPSSASPLPAVSSWTCHSLQPLQASDPSLALFVYVSIYSTSASASGQSCVKDNKNTSPSVQENKHDANMQTF